MLYLIGLGLDEVGISFKGMDIVKKCKKVYLENYTVDFPYSEGRLSHVLGKDIYPADRKFVESCEIVDEALKKDVALLVYGSPLTATTHITLVNEAKKSNVKVKIIHSSSIFDAVAETGLQLYKFGKVASMPAWNEKKNFTPASFIDIVLQNKSIHAHSLILIDIGLDFVKALEQLEKAAEKNNLKKIGKIIVCQSLGMRYKRIYYDFIENLKELGEKKEIKKPFCLIIPDKLHHVEEESLGHYA